MLNKYQKDAEEFRRVVRIIRAGMSWNEVRGFLGFNVFNFARALNIRTVNNRRTVSHAIWKKVTEGDAPEEPYINPRDIPAPDVPDVSKDIPCCDEEKTGTTLRWRKADEGKPITYSVNHSNNPNPDDAFTDAEIDAWFTAWSDVCGIKFERETGSAKGDIHIKFDRIDGPGNTLGFAWQPNRTAEFMEQAGTIAGDITIDSDEGSWPFWKSRSTGKHEVGHAIGMAHANTSADLMYGSIIFGRDRGPQRGDIIAALKKYPRKTEQEIPA